MRGALTGGGPKNPMEVYLTSVTINASVITVTTIITATTIHYRLTHLLL